MRMRSLWRTLAPATIFAVAAVTVLQLAIPISATSPMGSLAAPIAPAQSTYIPIAPNLVPDRTPMSAGIPPMASSHPGVGALNWYNITPGLIAAQRVYGFTALPPALTGAAISVDPTGFGGSNTVMFGGEMSNGLYSNQTWVLLSAGFEPASWINVTNDTDAPPALAWASMSFNPWIPGMVLFGGAYQNGLVSNETWILNDSTWTWTNYSTIACALFCPGARYTASMVFAADSADNQTILFGGCSDVSCFGSYNDTYGLYAFLGAWVWAPISTSTAPSPRWGAQMAWGGTGAANETWLFGGCEEFVSCSLNDTWEYYSGTWYNVTSYFTIFGITVPSGRTGASFTYDTVNSQFVLTGGFNDTESVIVDTWVMSCFSFCIWSNISSVTPGVATVWGSMASLTPFGEPVLFGGQSFYGGVASNTTWILQPATGFSSSISNSAPEVGQMVDFNSTVSGGALYDIGFAVWFWQPAGGPVTLATDNITRNFSTAGLWYANVTVLDLYSVSYSFTGMLTVGVPAINASASVAATDVGIPVHFVSSVSGSYTPPLNWTWWFGDGTNISGENVTHSFAAAGAYDPMVTLVDNYTTSNRTVHVVVNPDPTATATVGPTNHGVTGQNLTFTPHVLNGTAPFAYSWNFTDGSAPSSSPAPVHAFAAKGNYTVVLQVTDAVGYVTWANVTVHVLTVLSASATSNLTTAVTGASISFSATATGGTGGYTYAWEFGDSSSASNATVTHAFSTQGSYNVHVWVNDSAGHTATAIVSVTITAAPGPGPGGNPSGSSSSIPSWVWIVVVLVVLAAIVGAALMIRGRRKPPEPGPPGPTMSSSSSSPPPGATGGAPPPGATGAPPTPPT
jgi:PKD repeat protein